MKKFIKKGFTLIELIVVMAIFSILMVAVMALTGPVQRLFQKTAMSEKTYSYANNIQLYLQGKLEYAEDVWVCTSDKLDADADGKVDAEELAKLAEDFRKNYFVNTVGYDGNAIHYLNGKIHIIKLCNNAAKIGTEEVPKGQITHRIYNFVSNTAIASTADPEEKTELNNAFFNATDSAYNYNYALGSSNLKVVKVPEDDVLSEEAKGKVNRDIVYRALDKDIEDKVIDLDSTSITVSIVLDKRDNGSIDLPAVNENQKACKAFASPVAVQIANIPLTNINTRSKTVAAKFSGKGLVRPKAASLTDDVKLQEEGDVKIAYQSSRANSDFGFDNDIYFVFAYTDEIY